MSPSDAWDASPRPLCFVRDDWSGKSFACGNVGSHGEPALDEDMMARCMSRSILHQNHAKVRGKWPRSIESLKVTNLQQ